MKSSLVAGVDEQTRFVRGDPWDLPRELGQVCGRRGGPLVALIGGLHGNEPAGALAIRRVLSALSRTSETLSGRVVGLSGNRQALARGVRFVDRDLNRRWYEPELAALSRAPAETLSGEDGEQRCLYDRLAELERDGPLVIIDLHTTSGPSDPFVCFGDTLENRRLGLSLPITAILGLEEVIDGAMLGYYTDRGHTAISIETGQHRDPESVIRHEAAIWLCLSAVGAIARSDDPDYEGRRSLLAASSRGRPRVVDVRYRHVVRPEDEFVMDPGYRSFDPVASGRIVARDRRGPVRAPISGLMLMPRYQGQGEDGFFLVRRVAPFWLTVSSALRQIHAENVVSRLPGVTREDHRLESLIVDTSVARYLPVELMHLCGYRRTRRSEGSRQYWKKRDR